MLRDWSDTTVTPGSDAMSYPSFDAVIVYVSGDSEMKTKTPAASVVTVSFWEGDVALTFALAIGAPLVLSVTLPCRPPVVPAPAGPAQTKRYAAKNAVATEMRNTTRNLPKGSE